MKMSDVFQLPIIIDDVEGFAQSKVHHVADGVVAQGVALNILPYTVHAINNHDRLEQENAELREFAKRMINDITGNGSDQAKHYWNQELDKLLNK